MTKKIRIENADNGDHFVPIVQIWNMSFNPDGSSNPVGLDTLVRDVELLYPTALVKNIFTLGNI
jgi:hypothetical protein